MKLFQLSINAFAYIVLAFLPIGANAEGPNQEGETKMKELILDLSSENGQRRIGATKAIFDQGKAALAPLREAGAKQIAPTGGTVGGTRRLDIVYSVIEGFPPNAPKARAGYKTDSFGLHVENGTTEEDIQTLCRKYKCTLDGKFTAEGRPNCYLQIRQAKSLEAVIQQILSTEPKVTTINLNYFVQ